jgi:hypothetical protein
VSRLTDDHAKQELLPHIKMGLLLSLGIFKLKGSTYQHLDLTLVIRLSSSDGYLEVSHHESVHLGILDCHIFL